ncbi:MAG: sn-glycerol-3-phosphate ABC transporter ATP-binding protein UgpC, partial [Candidatus Izemoplasmatales bacterium]|nr:sn-glycerol-3-phosphate ABC transporter ATP-binding protein UgpC [Candidatus Izemoplasmatales bacterium]
MATLSFRALDKVYENGVQAVFDFSLEVKDKEFIVFVGPSGCGKSTTLRMVAGLEEITRGELYIDEVLVNDVAPKDRNIAMVFQSYALYPHMSVYDNMAFGLKLRKMPKDEIERRVKNAADILGLQGYLDRKPKALSGGQRQRVALGRAIVRDAKVFLMDEPLSNLDAKLRVAMRAELIKLHERLETTTIYVTHDQIEAMTMATRIVVMKDGRIQQIGAPKEIYDYPNNMFVGGFIGTPAMNFLVGEVKKDGYFYCENLKLKVP